MQSNPSNTRSTVVVNGGKKKTKTYPKEKPIVSKGLQTLFPKESKHPNVCKCHLSEIPKKNGELCTCTVEQEKTPESALKPIKEALKKHPEKVEAKFLGQFGVEGMIYYKGHWYHPHCLKVRTQMENRRKDEGLRNAKQLIKSLISVLATMLSVFYNIGTDDAREKLKSCAFSAWMGEDTTEDLKQYLENNVKLGSKKPDQSFTEKLESFFEAAKEIYELNVEVKPKPRRRASNKASQKGKKRKAAEEQDEESLYLTPAVNSGEFNAAFASETSLTDPAPETTSTMQTVSGELVYPDSNTSAAAEELLAANASAAPAVEWVTKEVSEETDPWLSMQEVAQHDDLFANSANAAQFVDSSPFGQQLEENADAQYSFNSPPAIQRQVRRMATVYSPEPFNMHESFTKRRRQGSAASDTESEYATAAEQFASSADEAERRSSDISTVSAFSVVAESDESCGQTADFSDLVLDDAAQGGMMSPGLELDMGMDMGLRAPWMSPSSIKMGQQYCDADGPDSDAWKVEDLDEPFRISDFV